MNTTFAGFWLRFVAYVIDYILIYVVQSFLFVPLLAMMGLSFASGMADPSNMSEAEAIGMVGSMMAMAGTTFLLSSIIGILYWTLMEYRSRWCTAESPFVAASSRRVSSAVKPSRTTRLGAANAGTDRLRSRPVAPAS